MTGVAVAIGAMTAAMTAGETSKDRAENSKINAHRKPAPPKA